MRSILIALFIGLFSIGAGACGTKRGTGAGVGAVGGAAVGGIVGGKTGALVGGILGGVVGYEVGRELEERDRRRIAYALEENRPVTWRNPDTGHYYEVEPTRTVRQYGRECREFRLLGEVNGQPDTVYGTACREPDGSWQML